MAAPVLIEPGDFVTGIVGRQCGRLAGFQPMTSEMACAGKCERMAAKAGKLPQSGLD
jgi:hypothetical protein